MIDESRVRLCFIQDLVTTSRAMGPTDLVSIQRVQADLSTSLTTLLGRDFDLDFFDSDLLAKSVVCTARALSGGPIFSLDRFAFADTDYSIAITSVALPEPPFREWIVRPGSLGVAPVLKGGVSNATLVDLGSQSGQTLAVVARILQELGVRIEHAVVGWATIGSLRRANAVMRTTAVHTVTWGRLIELRDLVGMTGRWITQGADQIVEAVAVGGSLIGWSGFPRDLSCRTKDLCMAARRDLERLGVPAVSPARAVKRATVQSIRSYVEARSSAASTRKRCSQRTPPN